MSIPGTVYAANYDNGGETVAYHDTDPGNNGGAYRTDDVDIQTTTDPSPTSVQGSGYAVGWTRSGEWLNYTVDIQTGRTYDLSARVASPGQGGTFHFTLDGSILGRELTVPDTGGWDAWASISEQVSLPSGTHVLSVVEDSGGSGNGGAAVGNLHYFTFTSSASGDTTAPSVPMQPQAVPVSSSEIDLTWSASTDNVGVTGYDVYRDGTKIGTTSATSYKSTGLQTATTYTYAVAAYDAAGNSSRRSTSVSATTLVSSSGAPPAYVQSHWAYVYQSAAGAPSTWSNTLSNSSAAGDLLLAWVDWDCGPETQWSYCSATPQTFQSITDNAGNSYKQIRTEHGYLGTGGADTTRLYWTIDKASGTRVVTVKLNNTATPGTFRGSFIAEYSGTDLTSPIDSFSWTNYPNSQNTTNPESTISTNSVNDTVASLLGASGSQSPTAGSGWTERFQGTATNPNHSGVLFPFGLEDKTIATPGTVNVPWTDSQAQGYGIWDVALKPAP